MINILIFLLIYGFIAYFLINVLMFMRQKNASDDLLLQKLDELINEIKERKKD
ncbi:hypothetical protein J6TS2_26220 [Heyndrickxia sporothermodurans]|nr:hypothetical protein J6TS2_26220 [Heyndrickxia sporothermodurans]